MTLHYRPILVLILPINVTVIRSDICQCWSVGIYNTVSEGKLEVSNNPLPNRIAGKMIQLHNFRWNMPASSTCMQIIGYTT